MDWAKSISTKLNGRKMTGKILMTQPVGIQFLG